MMVVMCYGMQTSNHKSSESLETLKYLSSLILNLLRMCQWLLFPCSQRKSLEEFCSWALITSQLFVTTRTKMTMQMITIIKNISVHTFACGISLTGRVSIISIRIDSVSTSSLQSEIPLHSEPLMFNIDSYITFLAISPFFYSSHDFARNKWLFTKIG